MKLNLIGFGVLFAIVTICDCVIAAPYPSQTRWYNPVSWFRGNSRPTTVVPQSGNAPKSKKWGAAKKFLVTTGVLGGLGLLAYAITQPPPPAVLGSYVPPPPMIGPPPPPGGIPRPPLPPVGPTGPIAHF